jgi:hemolysin III
MMNSTKTTPPPTPTTLANDEAAAWSYQESTCTLPHETTSSLDWRFTDFDHVPERSRDGSIYATDEVVNAATHLAASMFSLLGTVLLISKASAQHAPWKIVSFSIYGASLMFLFISSTLHHSISASEKVETFLRMLDYLAIYPLIAGTFTPLCLVFFHDSVIGWSFCMVVWALAIMGMVMTVRIFHKIPKWLSTTLYITLGWLGACMTSWLVPVLGLGGFAWFIVGGIFYTVGGYIYSTECLGIIIPGQVGFHEVWHVLVIVGALCHYWLMWHYVLPWAKA